MNVKNLNLKFDKVRSISIEENMTFINIDLKDFPKEYMKYTRLVDNSDCGMNSTYDIIITNGYQTTYIFVYRGH